MRLLTELEINYGYIKHNHFFCPYFCILKNGEIIDIHGVYDFPHYVAYQHMTDQQAYSNAVFDLDIFCYKPTLITKLNPENQRQIADLSDNPFSEVQHEKE